MPCAPITGIAIGPLRNSIKARAASGALEFALLVLGQVAVAITRSLALRIAIAAAFAAPAAVAGYYVAFALSRIGLPSLAWREIFACLGAVCVGRTPWTRFPPAVAISSVPMRPAPL